MPDSSPRFPLNPLGPTQTPVSRVGLGTWQLGGSDWGQLDEDQAITMLHRAVELGVNFFDTADVYGSGRSEKIIGRFLRETSEAVHVATKLGRRHDDTNGWPQNFTLAAAREHTQQSLKHLGLDSLFLTQWHCISTDAMRDGEVFDHLRTLQKEGLIQHWGVSVESVEEAHLCMQHKDCASLQVIFNIFRQKLVDELLPVAQEKGVGIIARVPLASGLLAGKFDKSHRFGEKDHRSYNAQGKAFNAGETFAGLPFEFGVDASEKVRDIVGSDVPLAQLALRWILDHPAVSTVIPGASNIKQIESNCAAALLPPLSQGQHEALSDLYQREIAGAIRGVY